MNRPTSTLTGSSLEIFEQRTEGFSPTEDDQRDDDHGITWTASELDALEAGTPNSPSEAGCSTQAETSNVTYFDSDFEFEMDELVELEEFNPCDSSTPRKKRKRNIYTMSPLETLRKECCSKQCIKSISINDITESRDEFGAMNESDQRNFIIGQVQRHAVILSGKPTEFKLIISGKTVCKSAWCMVYIISNSRFNRCAKLVQDGRMTVSHGNAGRSHLKSRTTEVMGWMDHFFQRVGDFMPHKSAINLPPTWNKKQVYQRMVTEFKERAMQNGIISYGHFAHVWRLHFPNIHLGKGSEFTKCSTCVELDEKFHSTKNEELRQKMKALKETHCQQLTLERDEYHRRRAHARDHPEECIAVIIDGMDQSKTNIPHLVTTDKATQHMTRLRTHLTGAIVHTDVPTGKVPVVFVDIRQFPHDPNLTINVLLRTLFLNRRHLSKTLYLQLDNCFRENKNRYVICFAALLVEYNIVDEVFLNFLVVGHTHEDIDQMFSTFANKIRQRNLYTLPDLYASLRTSYTPEVHVEELTFLYDFKKWLDPHMFSTMKNHSHPHCFRFKRHHGQTRMHYRMWSSGDWRPVLEYAEGTDEVKPESLGLVCLKSVPSLDDPPIWVVPSLDKIDVAQLQQDVPRGYEGRFTDTAIDWWRSYLKEFDEIKKVPEREESWMLERLVDFLNSRPSLSKTSPTLPRRLEALSNKLREDCPPVCIGSQGLPARPAPVTLMDGFQSLQEGMLVGLYVDYLPNRPQIAKLIEKDEANLTIKVHWYSSSWTGPCKPRFTGSASNRRPYTELVDLRAVILWDFDLTGKKGCLKNMTINSLKEKYKELETQ